MKTAITSGQKKSIVTYTCTEYIHHGRDITSIYRHDKSNTFTRLFYKSSR